MKQAMATGLLLLALCGLALSQTPAPPRVVWTKVTLTELDCMGCAKKVAKKMQTVPGVAEVRADLNAKAMYAVHKPGATPSPRGLWEAVEQAEHTPERMETPSGAHTSKPSS